MACDRTDKARRRNPSEYSIVFRMKMVDEVNLTSTLLIASYLGKLSIADGITKQSNPNIAKKIQW